MQPITPNLWFDSQAEEAANFYVSVFKNSKITDISRYCEAGAKVSGRAAGSVMTIAFELNGMKFLALNGGPLFQFSPAISFIVNCESQEEVDYYWEKLSEGGAPNQCGWLRDKYGVSWQIVPAVLPELIQGDLKKKERVMGALMQMHKIDISQLKKAAEGE